MKVYIFVDMEGISGISGSDHVTRDGCLYPEGRAYYTEEVNACVRGVLAAGADEVVVRDGHSTGRHLFLERLDPRVTAIQGPDVQRRLPLLEGAAAIILLGYHAKAGTAEAVMEHTYSSRHVQRYWLGGAGQEPREVGEIGVDAAIAGEQGVPVALVTGDDKACAEARAWIPDVPTCVVKQGLGCQSAALIQPARAREMVEDAARAAVASIATKPLRLAAPVTLRVEVMERVPLAARRSRPGARYLDGRTLEVEGATVEEVYWATR